MFVAVNVFIALTLAIAPSPVARERVGVRAAHKQREVRAILICVATALTPPHSPALREREPARPPRCEGINPS
jgi:hypothetical protein